MGFVSRVGGKFGQRYTSDSPLDPRYSQADPFILSDSVALQHQIFGGSVQSPAEIPTNFGPTAFAEPTGTDKTLTIPTRYTLHPQDFGFADTDGNAFALVRIASLATTGTLFYDSNGSNGGGRSAVTVGQTITLNDVLAGKLSFVSSGTAGSSFTFQVQDNSGSGNLDLTPNTLTFAPVASNAVNPTFGTLIDLTGLGAGDGFTIPGFVARDGVGGSVAGAGDVNGDGFADIVISAGGDDGGGNAAGGAYLLFGKASGFGARIDLAALTAADGFKIQGDLANDYAGSVSGAGDINGDGFADILIGAFGNDSGGDMAGAAYVIFGKSGGFGTLIDLTGLATTDGFKIQGDLAGDYAGYSVSSAGDVNGDGFADVLVGATRNADGGFNAGAAYVIFGKAGGFGTLIDLTALAPSDGFKVQGEATYDVAGYSVSSAGDINGDGLSDILIGAIGNDSGGNKAGAAYLVFGKTSGFGGLIDLTAPAGTYGFKIQGDLANDYAGFSVSSAGDVNGDGFADIIVGAPSNRSQSGTFPGAAYIIFGKAGGFDPLVDLTTLPATVGFKIVGGTQVDRLGTSVSGAGDVNGDGFADVLVGAVTNSDGGPNAGAAYIIFGKAGGFGASLNVNALTANDGFKIQGDAENDNAGASVSSAGDLNGDGFADILVGALGNAAGGTRAGAAYVIYGRANLAAPAGTDKTVTIPTNYTLHRQDFGFSDADGNAFASVKIASLATTGTLYYDSNGANGGGRSAVTVGQTITVNDILAGKLSFVASGTTGSSFTFQVQDNGASNAIDLTANTLTFAPVASNVVNPTFGALIDLTGLSATDGFKIQGDVASDFAGRGISAAGDVNGDGFADFVVSAYANDSGGLNAGAAYVIFGKASGFATLVDLTGLSAADGFKIQGDLAFDYAGRSVSSAGDVNGDGFADILVGAFGSSSGGARAGAAYVIFGKADGFGTLIDLTGLSASDGFKIQGDVADDRAGRSVSSAGDVNGDGFADILIGAYGNDSGGGGAGAAYVIFGKASGFGTLIDLTGLVATDGFKIQGDVTYDSAGRSVSSAGDVNGDGFADILVGANGNDSGGSDAGAAYVIFGKASGFGALIDLTGLSASNGFKIQGDFAFDDVGRSVSAAGDVNGDGFADILISAYKNSGGGFAKGAAYVVFGKASGFGTLIDLTGLAASDGFKIQGDGFRDYAGYSVSSAGDVNGDGFADILVGASGNDSGGSEAGAAYVIFGKASGFGTLIDLASLSATTGFKIQGDLAGDLAGRSVSAAGDINGDGFADILVGAYRNSGGGNDAGAAYVIFGRANLAAPAGTDKTLTIPTNYVLHRQDFGFSDADGNAFASVRIASLATTGTLYYDSNGPNGGGRSAVTVGQTITVNDILAGKLSFVASGTAGSSFTFQVQDNGASNAIDLTANTLTFAPVSSNAVNPTFGTLIDLTGLAATDGFKIQGDLAGDVAGRSVSSAGDVNGDGFADILVGADSNDSGGTQAGAAYVIFGKASGFGTLIDLTGLSAADGFKIQGDLGGDYAGRSVSSAGDVNGDGFVDILVGADLHSNGRTYAGAAYVIFGKASGFGTLIDLSRLSPANGFKIQGDVAGDRAGRSVSSAGDVNGDGFADILVGASGNDSGGNLAGAAYVIFGKASGFGTLIDLTGLSAANGFKIQGDLPYDKAGHSVSSAGDVNGDGFADILVGAFGNSSGGTTAGAAYVLFGKASGFGTLIDLTGLSAADGFKIQGDLAGDRAGYNVSSAGDVNGDGFADILIGADGNDSGGGSAGAAYVIFGKASGFGTLIDLTGLSATDGFKIQGDLTADNAGISVSSAGDVNGDGFADILVGAQGNGSGGTYAGAAYVIFGKASGFGALIDLTGLAAAAGFKIQGDAVLDRAGRSVSSAGDVNGDGFADILVGAYANDSAAGAAYVIFGRANPQPVAPTATNLSAAEAYTEDTPLNLIDIVATDPDSTTLTATLTLSNIAAGALSTATSGAITSTYVAATGVWTASGATADVNALLAGVTFNPAANFNGNFTVATSISDGVAPAATGTKTFIGIAIDDTPTAVNDTASVAENATTTISVLSNDTDIDGGPQAVVTINGATLSVGQSTTLASGAIVTLNANGVLGYDPNGRFNYLVSAATAGTTGASNSSAVDTFAYTVNGGSAATVSVTVNGTDGTGDQLRGNTGNDAVTGTNTPDNVDLSQGGNDIVSTGAGNDTIFFGATFNGADQVDGGGGSNDQLGLRGDYTGANALTLSGANLTGVETVALLAGFDYSVTALDDLLTTGQTMTIFGSGLGVGDNFTFDGSAETSGKFLVYGGLGTDLLTGGGGNDGFQFAAGRFDTATDIVNGGSGNDQVGLNAFSGTLSGANLINVESVVLLSGSNSILIADDWTLAGQSRTVFGGALTQGATIDGSAETNGRLALYGGSGNDVLTGGALADQIVGGGGADTIRGGLGADFLRGDGGADTFVLGSAADSTGATYDTLVGFDASADRIDLPGAITAIDSAISGGTLSRSSFDSDLTAALAGLWANHAVTFTADQGNLAGRIFLIADTNGIAGYQAGEDAVFELLNPVQPISDTAVFI